jgi:hypothetical protein
LDGGRLFLRKVWNLGVCIGKMVASGAMNPVEIGRVEGEEIECDDGDCERKAEPVAGNAEDAQCSECGDNERCQTLRCLVAEPAPVIGVREGMCSEPQRRGKEQANNEWVKDDNGM